ncbi:hypothetical protein [Hymenobacter properus]|uniref:Lipoprotein n=1 Tax=Hymenobacter properus TaxID=2791026 RepID=A0A931FJT9_9BACT|nr:hypothetical protein [Hymenobacter properus]MBF9140925.1 hypothetical protein [Hymenobacter properus]MBR7719734.1 hypothetical protein [Microvirga sp. SRT04]
MLKVLKFLFLTCTLLLQFSGAWACSCVNAKLPEKQKIAKAHAQANLVFTGRVVAEALVEKTDTVHIRTRTGADTVVTSSQQYRQFTFAVTQQFKGEPVAATVTVLTATMGASCGTSFRVGADVLIYAYRVDKAYGPRGTVHPVPPYFTTDLCTRNKELRDTQDAEVRQLQELARHG